MVVVNQARLKNHILKLATFRDVRDEGVTRYAFTPEYEEASKYVEELMKDAGLAVHRDALGNLIGKKRGSGEMKVKIITGSHIDTVRQGGMFDGTLGVLGAIEAVKTLEESGIMLDKDVEVCAFVDEEVSALGSRAYAGVELPDRFLRRLEEKGYTLEEFESCRQELKEDDCFLELHIEQGRVLEEHGMQIGEVDSILASVNYEGTAYGRADHAGATPMTLRKDAFMQLADFAERFRELVLAEEGTVGTIGNVVVTPGIRNVIPGRVSFVMEIRTPDESAIPRIEKVLRKEFGKEQVCFERTAYYKSAIMADEMSLVIQEVSEMLGLRHERIHSGAGHDTQSFADKVKAGMIFVPSVDGISHSAAEMTSWEDCSNGANVLANTIIKLGQKRYKGNGGKE